LPHQFPISDKEIAEDILATEKSLSDWYHKTALEASHPQVKNLVSQIHQESLASSQNVFEYLNQRGHYQPRLADQQTMNWFSQSVNKSRSSAHQNQGMRGGYGQSPQVGLRQPGLRPEPQQQYPGAGYQQAGQGQSPQSQSFEQQHGYGYGLTARQTGVGTGTPDMTGGTAGGPGSGTQSYGYHPTAVSRHQRGQATTSGPTVGGGYGGSQRGMTVTGQTAESVSNQAIGDQRAQNRTGETGRTNLPSWARRGSTTDS